MAGDAVIAIDYDTFLRRKIPATAQTGLDVPDSAFSPVLKPHQKAIARWMITGGRRACFASFGLGKTLIQLEACRVAREMHGGHTLITLPLGVRQEFVHDAGLVGITTRFIRSWEEVDDPATIYTDSWRPRHHHPTSTSNCSHTPHTSA